MSSVDVTAISLPRDARAFIDCWFRVYRDDPHWVPPLVFQQRRFLDPARNAYFAVADVQCFIARRDGEAVGTIAATVDHVYQEEDPGVGFFGFFEFIDDLEVAKALFETACEWLRAQGMDRAIGPFNFNTNHEFGLLVDGFDSDPFIANPHNGAYFAPMYEKLGLRKAKDWYAYWLDPGTETSERMERITRWFLERHPEFSFRPLDTKNYEREVSVIHEIYDDAWEQNWGHVKVGDAEFAQLAASFRPLLDPRLCWIAECEGEAVGLAIAFPDLNPVVKKMHGRLLPFGWIHYLQRRRHVHGVRVFILGVKQAYQHLPLGAPLYLRVWQGAIELGVRSVEASLILEDNHRMRGALERMGFAIYKTYRNFQITL